MGIIHTQELVVEMSFFCTMAGMVRTEATKTWARAPSICIHAPYGKRILVKRTISSVLDRSGKGGNDLGNDRR